MEELLRELAESKVLRDYLRSRVPKGDDAPGCAPNCKWILEDLEKNGKFTGHPKDFNGAANYPVGSKIMHLHLELVGGFPSNVEDGLELLPAVVARVRSMVVSN
jgi:hypothetical protein